jgi:hypothetical protein
MVSQLLLIAALASSSQPAPAAAARCEVAPARIVSRSPRGIPQVSNLDLLLLRASVPSRPYPASGEGLYALQAEATVYSVSPKGEKSIVSSSVKMSGGGDDEKSDWTEFWLDIPIDATERAAETLRYLTDIGVGPGLQEKGAQAFAGIFRQHRVGTFQVECRVLDQGRLLGVGRADLEVLFKGNFFDQDAFRKP